MTDDNDRCPICGKERKKYLLLFGTTQEFHVLCDCEAKKRDEEQQERRMQARAEEIQRNRSAGFTDPKMKACTFWNDDGKNPALIAFCKNYVAHFQQFRNEGKGLLFCGPVGNGKTYAAAAIANALIDLEYRVLMTNMTRIINHMWKENDKNEYIDSLKSYALLIIDDFAAERNTDYINDIVFQVIDARYRSGLPLIITTNMREIDLAEPTELAKQRIYSRILEMCLPVSVRGEDRRKANSKKTYDHYLQILKGEEQG